MNSTDAIALKKAESRYTRAKLAVDGTDEAEQRYQDAKRKLAKMRIALRGHTPYSKPADAVASITSLRASATPRKVK